MKTLNRTLIYTLTAMALLVAACDDTNLTADQIRSKEPNTIQGWKSAAPELQGEKKLYVLKSAKVSGRTIRRIKVPLKDGGKFEGRITNLKFEEGPDSGTVLASGRLIGWADGKRVNQRFEDVVLKVFDKKGHLVDGKDDCHKLFLKINPILREVLGNAFKSHKLLVVKIKAENGPSKLLGRELCDLLDDGYE